MTLSPDNPRSEVALRALLLAYLIASIVHFTHNAEFVHAYPNLPAWITRSSVYLAWLGVTAIGLGGYLLRIYGRRLAGFILLCVYAALGLDGLLHYTLAPVMAHSGGMNFSIWFEVAMALLLLGYLALCARRLIAKTGSR